jgi:hypothetical protein
MKKSDRKRSKRREWTPPAVQAGEEADRRRIRAILSKPMNKRTHFLRVRLPNGGSSI